jgi:hypothetical protein
VQSHQIDPKKLITHRFKLIQYVGPSTVCAVSRIRELPSRGPCCLPQQFAASDADISAKNRVAVLSHPDQVIFAVPNGVAATLVRFHLTTLYRKRFLIPYRDLIEA